MLSFFFQAEDGIRDVAVTGVQTCALPITRRSAVDGIRKERRGFASMSPEKQREIASKGGRAAHEKGTAHEWTADEARAAGRKGGDRKSTRLNSSHGYISYAVFCLKKKKK